MFKLLKLIKHKKKKSISKGGYKHFYNKRMCKNRGIREGS